MKTKFDVKITEKDLFQFNMEQAYKGSQGILSILFFILLCAAAVMGFMRGQIFYSVLYIIVGIIVMVYVPLSLKGRVKTVIKTNKVFSEPLHFEIDEKLIKVSQGEETAELPYGKH